MKDLKEVKKRWLKFLGANENLEANNEKVWLFFSQESQALMREIENRLARARVIEMDGYTHVYLGGERRAITIYFGDEIYKFDALTIGGEK